jgi:hypothetical protein
MKAGGPNNGVAKTSVASGGSLHTPARWPVESHP